MSNANVSDHNKKGLTAIHAKLLARRYQQCLENEKLERTELPVLQSAKELNTIRHIPACCHFLLQSKRKHNHNRKHHNQMCENYQLRDGSNVCSNIFFVFCNEHLHFAYRLKDRQTDRQTQYNAQKQVKHKYTSSIGFKR